MVGENAENREKARVAGGDTVDVEVVDTEPREVTVPADFAARLSCDAKAGSTSIAGPMARRPSCWESRERRQSSRRIENALADLKEAASK